MMDGSRSSSGHHGRGPRGIPEEDDSALSPNTVSEATPLLPPHVQIEVSKSLKENQDKWKHLMDIDASNNTAQQMADDIDVDIEALKFFDDKEFPRTQHDMSRSLSLSNIMYSPLSHDTKTASVDVNKFMVAAAFIEDGIHGRKIGYRIDAQALRMVRWFHSTWYRYLFNVVGIGCCALAFVEDGQARPLDVWSLVELLCLLGFSMDVYYRYAMSSDKTKAQFRQREPWATLRFVLLVVTFAEMGLCAAGVSIVQPRYTRIFRPFMVIARRRNIRVVFASFLRALKDVAVVLALTLCVVLFFGLMGFLLFADSSVILNVPYFATLGDSLYNMLLIQSCLPVMMAVMLPYYVQSQWSALYFVVFVLFTNFFLVKLTIAVSYRRYKRNTEKMLYKRLQKRKIALSKAFELLSDDPLDEDTPRTITLDAWLNVCRFLKPKWTSEEAEVVFYSSDVQQTNAVDFTAFIQLSSVLVNASVSRRHRRPSLFIQDMKKWQTRTRNFLLAQTTVWGYPVIYMEVFVGFLICLSVVQATQVNNYALTNSLNHTWRLVGVGLLSLFTVEILLKLFAFGSTEFFNRPFCQFDIVVAVVGWLFYAMTSLVPAFPVVFYDLALAVRSLRVLKLLNLFPPFHSILWTMNRIIPLIGQLFLVILSVVYVFAILAQANYGQVLATFPDSLKANASAWYIHKEEFQLDTFEKYVYFKYILIYIL
ncbi:hypothetical protein, variant 2 [Aphanomyces astaci]|uniref:Ion transport domain-containing protein n=1 Tax=Aphanomyces astaci TaxID=112090 RepID=W4FZ18_APHAT|nr:hypothetical protein, variant 3 [Aphanomyces astaci]XP_009838298.1 hypothetical protein, variant 2 [Aphanomyces astaci]ETV72231.1 hypothetical protein, variant 2 [Aphanomyces astaci]ETV72232.1 hypothetical protein, variant 3 [Aphanomyces astaci]|eukprot:XP_009838297.1 hypothetical protein, variant 3 [Aphanomyces astaci]